ncbi:MAG: cobalamin-independent methionine synthase II family protein [Vicinamibacterales bacterium]|jgi:5-methyltetrahydropteroyltriglutamate--homocysteine methyltransferase|nr:methionine synthase [Acidobacteriota bacterium]MDP6373817.1 cobalamin-independent methionine synthase II family protein [Vicinamibacterales bacterium]MDP6607990.1 cobalamin-independent methionine synthase II family protein [Vicinamibacterales bacterium]HAK55503.1 methionine synthase [Acidobacteriota bacterium]|tara:strand:+ start:10314 stop:11318 length:1005 start_codon:yes stop_codon:yes gene_type:complete
MSVPAIRTETVGSYPTPAWLTAMPSRPALRDALLVVLKTQELAGLDVVGDGELARFDVNHPDTNGMIEFFIHPLGGVAADLTPDERAAFRQQPGMEFRSRPAGVVRDRLDTGTLDLAAYFHLLPSLTDRPIKFTVTSPYMLAKTLLDRHYGDLRALCADLAAILADQVRGIDAAVLQVDEANLTGHPEDRDWAHEPINTVLDAASGGKAVHLCFGNYGGSTIQHGTWRDLLPFLNALHADHVLLEFARRGYDELEVLRDLRPELALGVGVIDIKDNEAETPEIVADRIERAARVLGPDRIRWVHPDCGFWMLPRSVADRKMTSLVKGRDLFLGC